MGLGYLGVLRAPETCSENFDGLRVFLIIVRSVTTVSRVGQSHRSVHPCAFYVFLRIT